MKFKKLAEEESSIQELRDKLIGPLSSMQSSIQIMRIRLQHAVRFANNHEFVKEASEILEEIYTNELKELAKFFDIPVNKIAA